MTPKTITRKKEIAPEIPEIPETPPAAETTCVHHWIIEPPTQRISKGVCKLCGAVKEFENWAFEVQ